MKTLNAKVKKIFFFLIIVIICGAIITIFLYKRNKYKDLCAYTEKLLEIEWNDCIESAAGDVILDRVDEEYAHIRLEIKEGSEEEALSIVQNRFVNPLDFSRINIPVVLNYRHEFAAELKNSDIQYVFETFMRGKRARTREIRVYVVYDESRRMYIYVMG